MPKLIFTGEHFAGRVYELTLEKTTVGRGDHNTLALHHSSVSLAHCEILAHGAEVIVRDLGSANGTYVNGVRLDHQQCQMKSNQTVRFGSVEARLDLGLPAWDDTASEETAVFAMRRNQRDQRRKEKNPKPANPSATFDSGADSGSEETDHTVLLPRTPSAERIDSLSEPRTPEVPPRKALMGRVAWMGVALAFIAFLAWLIWGRR